MRYQADYKGAAKTKLLDGAGRGFRRQGYAGIGIDGLAKEAGVTSGAFYGHFKSKDAAFEAVAVAGLEALCTAIATLQEEQGAQWAEAFIDFYLSDRLTCALEQSCGLQSLSAEVMRAGEATKTAYGSALARVAEQLAARLNGVSAQERLGKAWALMALLSGGVTLARSVASAQIQQSIAAHLKKAALALL